MEAIIKARSQLERRVSLLCKIMDTKLDKATTHIV